MFLGGLPSPFSFSCPRHPHLMTRREREPLPSEPLGLRPQFTSKLPLRCFYPPEAIAPPLPPLPPLRPFCHSHVRKPSSLSNARPRRDFIPSLLTRPAFPLYHTERTPSVVGFSVAPWTCALAPRPGPPPSCSQVYCHTFAYSSDCFSLVKSHLFFFRLIAPARFYPQLCLFSLS